MEQEPFQIAKRLREDEFIYLDLLNTTAELLEKQAHRIIVLNQILAQGFKAYVEGKQSHG